jgi:tetratricopeptide (TPR) repeat protein
MNIREFRYRAFISYSHRDERWARWLHRALERYTVPRRLVGRETPQGIVPVKLAPVFRDREELPTATDLGRVVNAALEQSSALIVICSPAAARSRWVNEEIRTFQRLGRAERIFCVIVAGAPEAVDEEQCFPEALRNARGDGSAGTTAAEPIAADMRPGGDGPHAALIKLVAGMLGLGLDELARRDLQVRQRRLLAITVSAVVGMAMTSLLATVALIARNDAQRQRALAETAAVTAQQTSEFLVQLFEVADPSEARGNSVTAREILDRGAARIDRDLADQPAVRGNLMLTMGRVYTGLGLYEPATELLAHALDLRESLTTEPTADALATANALGLALYLKGEYASAEAIYRDAAAAARTLYPDGDPLLSEAISGVAEIFKQHGDFDSAEREYRAALAIDRKLHAEPHADVARSLAGLAGTLMYQDRFDESEAAFRESLLIRRQTLGDDHPLVAETLNELGSLMYFSGDADAAEAFMRDAMELYRRILGNEHPFVSTLLNNIGRLSLERGDLAAAEALLSEALAMDRKFKDPDHDDFVFKLNNLGLVRLGQGQTEAAATLLDEALRIAQAHEHRMLGQVWANLAAVHARAGRRSQALDALAAARPLLEAQYPDDPWHLANLASIEGSLRLAEGDSAAAEALLRDSHSIIAARWHERGLFVQLSATRMADFHTAVGASDLAEPFRRLAEAR